MISKCLTCRTIGRFVGVELYDVQSKANIIYFVIGWSIDCCQSYRIWLVDISFRSILVCDLFSQCFADNDNRDKRTIKLTIGLSTKYRSLLVWFVTYASWFLRFTVGDTWQTANLLVACMASNTFTHSLFQVLVGINFCHSKRQMALRRT